MNENQRVAPNAKQELSILETLFKLVLTRREKKILRKAATILSKHDLYEKYFVSLLSVSDLKLLLMTINEYLSVMNGGN